MTLEEFLKANYPDVLKVYEAWSAQGWELEVDDLWGDHQATFAVLQEPDDD